MDKMQVLIISERIQTSGEISYDESDIEVFIVQFGIPEVNDMPLSLSKRQDYLMLIGRKRGHFSHS